MNNIIRYSLLIISLLIIYTLQDYHVIGDVNLKPLNGQVNIPKSMIMYDMIEKYSDIYQIPKHIAYNIAYRETRYKGPFHWEYVPEQGSNMGALGPMQIMLPTGKSNYNKSMGFGDQITEKDIRNNIELNVMISMKILNKLYHKYDNWAIVCGIYNTGQVIVNEYAQYCSSNKDYKDNWVSHE